MLIWNAALALGNQDPGAFGALPLLLRRELLWRRGRMPNNEEVAINRRNQTDDGPNSIRRRSAIRALLERREEQRKQRKDQRLANKAERKEGRVEVKGECREKHVWRQRKELIEPSSYLSIPLLQPGGTLPTQQSLFNEHLSQSRRGPRSSSKKKPAANKSSDDDDDDDGDGDDDECDQYGKSRSRSASPVHKPHRLPHVDGGVATAAVPATAAAATTAPSAPPAAPKRTEEPTPTVKSEASCQTEEGAVAPLPQPLHKRQVVEVGVIVVGPRSTGASDRVSAMVEASAAATDNSYQDQKEEERSAPPPPPDGVVMEEEEEGEEPPSGPAENELQPSAMEREEMAQVEGKGPHQPQQQQAGLRCLGPLPMRGRVHVCVNKHGARDLMLGGEDDYRENDREMQVWSMLGGQDLLTAEGGSGGGGPVVLLELGPQDSDLMLVEGGQRGRPREYLLVRDIEGPLGHDGFEQQQLEQQGGDSPRPQARAAVVGPAAAEARRVQDERLKKSLVPLVAGVTDISQQIRRIEDQAEGLEEEMADSRRRLEDVQKEAVKEMETLLQYTLERRKESRELVESLDLTGNNKSRSKQQHDHEEWRPSSFSSSSPRQRRAAPQFRSSEPGNRRPAWHIPSPTATEQGRHHGSTDAAAAAISSSHGLEVAEAELSEARNIMCELEIEIAKMLHGHGAAAKGDHQEERMVTELTITNNTVNGGRFVEGVFSNPPSTIRTRLSTKTAATTVMKRVQSQFGMGGFYRAKKVGVPRPGWKI